MYQLIYHPQLNKAHTSAPRTSDVLGARKGVREADLFLQGRRLQGNGEWRE